MKRILFLIEQWCDGNPHCGFSQPLTNYAAPFSCRETRFIFWDNIHPGAQFRAVDSALREDIGFCLFCDTGHPWKPSDTLLTWIASRVPLVCLWHDCAKGFFRNIDGAALNVGMDGVDGVSLPNYVPLWTPVDSALFRGDPSAPRSIDILYPGSPDFSAGTIKAVCHSIAKQMQDAGLKITFAGGQRAERLTWEQYAALLADAKIVVDFPRNEAADRPQLKGRLFEAAACGAAIVTEDFNAVHRHFEDVKEIMLVQGELEYIDNCRLLLANDAQRIGQAANALERLKRDWSLTEWWNRILTHITT